jgi:hypothetical protein
MGAYQMPKVLKRWVLDVPDGDFHELNLQADDRVCMASGRFAHGSGSASCTWADFLAGEMNALVTAKLGAEVLEEARTFISDYGVE